MSSLRRQWVVPVAAVAVLAFIVLAALVAFDAGATVPRGVTIDGVDVGGSSPEAAERAVAAHAGERVDEPILFTGPRMTVETSGTELGAEPRVDEAVAEAGLERFGRIRSGLGLGNERDI